MKQLLRRSKCWDSKKTNLHTQPIYCMKIMKFGGTSVGRPERMHQVKDLITRGDEPKIIYDLTPWLVLAGLVGGRLGDGVVAQTFASQLRH